MTGSLEVIRARTLVAGPQGPAISDGAIAVDDGVVVSCGRFEDLQGQGSIVAELEGVLMPGMVDAHSHLRGIPLADQGIPPRPLEGWLCSLGALTELPPGDDARIAMADLLAAGVTSVQGMLHSFADEPGYRRLADEVHEAAIATGIRALIVLGFSDRAEYAPEPAAGDWAHVAAAERGMDAAAFSRFATSWLRDTSSSGRVRAAVGPVASQWATSQALEAIADSRGGRRVHTHLAESAAQRHWVCNEPSAVQRLTEAALLDDGFSAAHGVDLTGEELRRLASSGACLVHCPVSNRLLRVGSATVARWHAEGVDAALGIDSQNERRPDMFEVMREALATSDAVGEPLTASQVFAMATTGGGRALGVPGLGELLPGSPADAVELDLAPSRLDLEALLRQLVMEASADLVRNVWVEGERVVAHARPGIDVSGLRSELERIVAADAPARESRHEHLAASVAIAERLTREMAW